MRVNCVCVCRDQSNRKETVWSIHNLGSTLRIKLLNWRVTWASQNSSVAIKNSNSRSVYLSRILLCYIEERLTYSFSTQGAFWTAGFHSTAKLVDTGTFLFFLFNESMFPREIWTCLFYRNMGYKECMRPYELSPWFHRLSCFSASRPQL